MRIIFTGTNAGTPTANSGTSGVFIQLHGKKLLFDCGEGTQQRMMRFGASINVDSIFFSHLDSDHVLGLPGLIRTLELNGRDRPLNINVSEDMVDRMRTLVAGVHGWPDFQINIRGFKSSEVAERFNGFRVNPFKTIHDKSSHGFVIQEDMREGELKVDKLQEEFNLKPSEKYSQLKSGETVEDADGRTITPDEVVGEERQGRKVVYTGDTKKSQNVVGNSRDAHLLIHESTFSSRDSQKASKTQHSTVKEAAEVALQANVRELVLTHISPRYGGSRSELAEEAKDILEDTDVRVAHDGMELKVEY